MNLYDIARDAGTTRTVVSLVINGKADKYRIARATQDRVRAVVRRTGYVPDRFVHEMFLNRQRGGGAGSPPDPVRLKAVVEAALAATGYRMPVRTVTGDPATAPGQVGLVVGEVSGVEQPLNPIPIILPDDRHAVVASDEGGPPAPAPAPVPTPEPEGGTSVGGQGEDEEPPTPEPPPEPVIEPVPDIVTPTPAPEPPPVPDPVIEPVLQPNPPPEPVPPPEPISVIQPQPPPPAPEPPPAPPPTPEPTPSPAPPPVLEPGPIPEPNPVIAPEAAAPVPPTLEPPPIVDPAVQPSQ